MGSVAAILLAQHSIDVVLLEAGVDCARDLRASSFHPPTLEVRGEIAAETRYPCRVQCEQDGPPGP